MELKNKSLAGMAMEDDALETVTGGASLLYEQEPPTFGRPTLELPPFEPKLPEDIMEIHKKMVEIEKSIGD